MPLTDAAIRRARPSDNQQKISDGGGLYLYLTPTGARSWRWKYRIAGKEKLLSIGLYPDVSLARAREARDEARRLLARGVDPGVQKKAAALAHSALGSDSFETIANEWLATRPWVPSYAEKIEAWMKYGAWPWIGSRSVAGLTAPDFLRVAPRIEDRGAIESAHRIMQNCGQIMRYAVATGRAERNPVADLKGALAAAKEAHHAAITAPCSWVACCAPSRHTADLPSPARRCGWHRWRSCVLANCGTRNGRNSTSTPPCGPSPPAR